MAHRLAGLLLLALAVSFDGLGAGFGFGLKKVRIDWRCLLVIGLVAGATVLVACGAGHLIGRRLGEALAGRLGGALLVGLGFVNLASGEPEPAESRPVLSLELRTWGLVVEVARHPGEADLDRSGTISVPEALVLGLALALDGGAVGLGAGMSGFAPLAAALWVAPVNVGLLWLGELIGRRLTEERRQRWLRLCPGLILLALGVGRLI
ncbi:MAG: manganese efflux pump [Chitinophagales bacterium]